MMIKSHYFFPLVLNPWPVICSLASWNFFSSSILLLKSSNGNLFFISVMNIALSAFTWWVMYSSEMNSKGSFSTELGVGVKFSFCLFISSEIFFFLAFFWSYYHFYLVPMPELGWQWPPEMITSFDPTSVPMLNTLTLMVSGLFVTLSHKNLLSGSKTKYEVYLFLTIIMGFVFLIFQYKEYLSSFFTLGDSSFGTSFFMLTGFHGIHVMVGSLFLFYVWTLNLVSQLEKSQSLSFEMSAWYWHFVDVVWLFLYYSLYYLNI